MTRAPTRRVWLFDLDNTLHDASHAAFGQTNLAMNEYMVHHLGLNLADAARLRQHYWQHYGATLLGLVRHHGVPAAHFLHETHRLPGLEQRVSGHRHDLAALRRLRGAKFILTNAPTAPLSRAWVASEALAFATGEGWQAELVPDFDEALRLAPSRGATVLVTGSFHTVGDAMSRLQVSPTDG